MADRTLKPKVLSAQQTRSVASWLTERVAEMEIDKETIRMEDPHLMPGLRILVKQLHAQSAVIDAAWAILCVPGCMATPEWRALSDALHSLPVARR